MIDFQKTQACMEYMAKTLQGIEVVLIVQSTLTVLLIGVVFFTRYKRWKG